MNVRLQDYIRDIERWALHAKHNAEAGDIRASRRSLKAALDAVRDADKFAVSELDRIAAERTEEI